MKLHLAVLLLLISTVATVNAQSVHGGAATKAPLGMVRVGESAPLGAEFPMVARSQEVFVPITASILIDKDTVPEPCTPHIWNDCGGNSNPSSCQADKVCSTVHKDCRDNTGSKCYDWIDDDGNEHCRAC